MTYAVIKRLLHS